MTQPFTTPVERAEISTRTILDCLARLATSSRARKALVKGYEEHGEAFAAFSAGTRGLYVRGEDVLETFYASYAIKARSLPEVYSELIEHTKPSPALTSAVENMASGGGVEDFLRWYTDALREQVERRYVFVEGPDHWYVFDSEPINQRLG